eukprot:6483756-Amphidinium_carterae.1
MEELLAKLDADAEADDDLGEQDDLEALGSSKAHLASVPVAVAGSETTSAQTAVPKVDESGESGGRLNDELGVPSMADILAQLEREELEDAERETAHGSQRVPDDESVADRSTSCAEPVFATPAPRSFVPPTPAPMPAPVTSPVLPAKRDAPPVQHSGGSAWPPATEGLSVEELLHLCRDHSIDTTDIVARFHAELTALWQKSMKASLPTTHPSMAIFENYQGASRPGE